MKLIDKFDGYNLEPETVLESNWITFWFETAFTEAEKHDMIMHWTKEQILNESVKRFEEWETHKG